MQGIKLSSVIVLWRRDGGSEVKLTTIHNMMIISRLYLVIYAL